MVNVGVIAQLMFPCHSDPEPGEREEPAFRRQRRRSAKDRSVCLPIKTPAIGPQQYSNDRIETAGHSSERRPDLRSSRGGAHVGKLLTANLTSPPSPASAH